MVEFAVAAAIFLLRDVFSSWTLWYMPPKLNHILRQLDLTTPLGYDGAADLNFFLNRIEEIDWAAVPLAQNVLKLRTGEEDQSPGRNAEDAGDYVSMTH